jgi:RimJ/RimL family protein N-acetyltransferase
MRLRPLQTAADFELAASWLQRRQNNQWLDFGNGRQGITPDVLRVMAQRDTHFIRVYTIVGDDNPPIGIVGLNNVDRNMRTGTLWVVAGEKSFRHRGWAHVATSRLLTLAFQELGLRSVNTWIVEHNPSQRGVARLGFRFIGRQRQCHFIDGQAYDRLLFDLLASEHREIAHPGHAAAGTAEQLLAARRWTAAGLSCSRAASGAAAVLASLLAGAAAGAVGTNGPDAASFSCTFAPSSWSGCGFTVQAQSSDRITPIAVAGVPGVRLETLPGDHDIAGSGAAERADLALSPQATGCEAGAQQWWRHALLFPDDYVLPRQTRADPWPWGVVFDFHHTGSAGQANFQIEVAGDPPALRLAISGGPQVSNGAPGSPTRRFPVGAITRNHWYEFVYHVRWSSGADGFFDAWVDGRSVLAYHGPTLYAGQGCYLKLANYHTPVGKPVSVVHAHLARAATQTALGL